MSISHKSSSSQLYRMMIYKRALHPELFQLQGRKKFARDAYEAEAWVTSAGHVIRFQADGETISEAVIERGDHLPETGLTNAIPCIGEKDLELRDEAKFPLGFVTTIQTENLSENLYHATLREMRDFIEESGSVSFEWIDSEDTPCLAVLDTQLFKREFHVQSYHLLGQTGTVLRTQSIFEVL